MMMLHEAAHAGTAGSVGVSTAVSKDRITLGVVVFIQARCLIFIVGVGLALPLQYQCSMSLTYHITPTITAIVQCH